MHNNDRGAPSPTPREMDDRLNQLCKENNLIKGRLLEAIGSSRYRYASKMKHNGLSIDEFLSLRRTLAELSHKAKAYSEQIMTMTDHYEGLNKIAQDLLLEKQVFVTAMGKHRSYISETLRKKRKLEEEEKKKISIELINLSEKLKLQTETNFRNNVAGDA